MAVPVKVVRFFTGTMAASGADNSCSTRSFLVRRPDLESSGRAEEDGEGSAMGFDGGSEEIGDGTSCLSGVTLTVGLGSSLLKLETNLSTVKLQDR